jgi:hypothetical protein
LRVGFSQGDSYTAGGLAYFNCLYPVSPSEHLRGG